MPTKTSICNLAISWVAGYRVTDVDNDDSKEAQICRDNYSDMVKAVLEDRAWTFATKRYKWTPLALAPEWGYAKQFLIPTDIVSVREVHKNDTYANGANDVDWRKEVSQNDENVVVCDLDIIYVKATKHITDENKFSPGFVQALAARLAAIMAIPVAESRTLQSDMWGLYDKLIGSGAAVDGMQGKNDRIRSRSLTKVR